MRPPWRSATGAYKALERLLADGKVRAIGVSNFMPEHLTRLLEATEMVPAVNQIELHPYFTQPGVQKADAERGIINFDVLGFDLTADELDALDALDTGVRGGPEPASITLENFGRPIPEA